MIPNNAHKPPNDHCHLRPIVLGHCHLAHSFGIAFSHYNIQSTITYLQPDYTTIVSTTLALAPANNGNEHNMLIVLACILNCVVHSSRTITPHLKLQSAILLTIFWVFILSIVLETKL